MYLSISLPFGNGGRVGYDMQNSSHSTTHRMSWNDTLDERNSWACLPDCNPTVLTMEPRSAVTIST
ncbi:hypothetical protein ACULNC_15250 [Shigella flexneri]